eukprot:12910829-Prorocentrum_lima.AAC.1
MDLEGTPTPCHNGVGQHPQSASRHESSRHRSRSAQSARHDMIIVMGETVCQRMAPVRLTAVGQILLQLSNPTG